MIFIFFISLAGYISFLSTKVTKTYVPVLTLSLIGLCIYIGGIFHILQIMAYIVLLIGMILRNHRHQKNKHQKIIFSILFFMDLMFYDHSYPIFYSVIIFKI